MKYKNNKLLNKTYNEGFHDGKQHGFNAMLATILPKLETLSDVDGIGDKTIDKILRHLELKK